VAPGATHTMAPDAATLDLDPLTFRAPLDPFKIHRTLVTFALDASFEGGSPGQFVQDHLVNGACP
jgi:hypothetical protein